MLYSQEATPQTGAERRQNERPEGRMLAEEASASRLGTGDERILGTARAPIGSGSTDRGLRMQ